MKAATRSFVSGELDPGLHQRADLQRYSTGLALCRNFIVRPQGGVVNRPGLRFIGEVADSTRKTRLIPFEFNTEQTYILEFGHLIMRVIKDGGYVLDGDGPALYEIVTPYHEDDLDMIKYTQSADVMTLCHRDYAARDLSRLDHDSWTLAVINFSNSVAQPVISTISAVGSGAGTNSKTYRYVVTATVDGVESFASNEASISTGSLSVTAGVRLEWGAVADAQYYTIYKDASNGSGLHGFVGETKVALYEDYNIAPDTSVTPPEESVPISSVGNYAGTVGYYQQRKLFAATHNEPQTFFATQSGVFNSLRFSRPARDSDGITFSIASQKVNEIRHIVAIEDLMLLTSGAVYKVTEGQDYVLTPSTIGAKPQNYLGASDVRPAVINDSILFVQDQGQRIRDLNYAIDDAKYIGNDLTIMAEHLFVGKTIVDVAYSDDPTSVLWCILDDGTLAALTYQKEHKVWAWHRHETDGVFESVAVISEFGHDTVYFVVRRLINGVWKRYVERMGSRVVLDAVDSFFLDSGLSYNGAPITSVSGLTHLEGKEVVALADGNVVRGLTVTSGALTLPREASVIHIGLPYSCEIATLGIDSNEQPTLGRKKNVAEVAIRVLESRGGWVGPDIDNMIEIKPRFVSDGYDTIALKTFEQRVNIAPEWNDDGRVIVQQRDPLPMTILAITPEFDIGG